LKSTPSGSLGKNLSQKTKITPDLSFFQTMFTKRSWFGRFGHLDGVCVIMTQDAVINKKTVTI